MVSAVFERDDLKEGDLAVVQWDKYLGKLCRIIRLHNLGLCEIQLISEIAITPESTSDTSDTITSKKKQKKPGYECVTIQRENLRRVPWPGLREPPQPRTVQELLKEDWVQISDQSYSESRLRDVWGSLSKNQRVAFQRKAAKTKVEHRRLAEIRCLAMSLLQEMLDLAPKSAPSAYKLFVRDRAACRKGGDDRADLTRNWRELPGSEKDAFCRRANDLAKSEIMLKMMYNEVLVGYGWSESRGQFFPMSAKRCLLVLLLCQRRRDCLASLIDPHIWKEHIFPYVPCHWFCKIGP